MKQYYPLVVSEVREETKDAVSIAFAVPPELSDLFQYEPGQYLNVRAMIDNVEVRRSYSICSAPHEHVLRVAVKHVPGGAFSTYANQVLQAGDVVDVMPPQGKFTLKPADQKHGQFLFFAAGSGITPVISLVKSILFDHPDSSVVLFYGNRNADSIIFKEELEGLKNVYLDRLSLYHIISGERQSAPLFDGRIDKTKCEVFARTFFDLTEVERTFICGPESMIHDVRAWLTEKGVSTDQVSFELFTAGSASAVNKTNGAAVAIDPKIESQVTIRIDGSSMDFPLEYGGSNILDAAIAAGADAPFSCKGGVCCTCKAMLLEGEVQMDVVYGLEPDEIEDGFILTCQSHPRTEKVLVDFDLG